MRNFIVENKNILIGVSILLLTVLIYGSNPFGLEYNGRMTISICFLIILLWITEIIPMPITSLLPLILFPILNLSKAGDVCNAYSDQVIFLFMGGFFLAIAIEKWNLHKRIALHIINLCGYDPSRILLGFMLSTFFISMWISNTATTLMMFPIAMSIIHVLAENNDKTTIKNFTIAILLSIAYSSNIGGLATIIGTPPNSAFVAFARETYEIQISFLDWLIICGPLALFLLIIVYLIFNYTLFPHQVKNSDQGKLIIQAQINKLGKWRKAEIRVMIIFLFMAIFWICRDLFIKITQVQITDTSIALIGAVLLFLVPSGDKKIIHEELPDESSKHINRILNWEDTKKMGWGILLMFGGGLALAKQLENVGILNSIGQLLSASAPSQLFLLIFLVSTLSIFLSEIMSNIAQVIVLSPIICSTAINLGLNPLVLGIPMCLTASCAGMLPMGTPPNAIVYGSGKIPIRIMMKAGLIVNLISIGLISIVFYFKYRS